ncbi:unnamed protein product [Ceutorhynchus assimilis]|uniref:Uncharacterized protein n=1 Tax=Ceutorhynchus assimilis TaxID=467358 RepID=A0A9N9QK37_9CUCU|nr:unnamed protein product [Ceutorhynchus assimilis]
MDQSKVFNRLESYESQIASSPDTKSSVSYHMMKQSLHNMWSAVYSTESCDSRTANIKKIQECLSSLERKVTENEQKKYQLYYGKGQDNLSNRGAKCC